MGLALREAQRAREAGEVPIGAIIVRNDQIIARACNQVELLHDATAHAEMLAITQAENALGDWRLNETTLYVTKEPCAMCAGAMVNARVGRLVFGVADPRCGGAGGAFAITHTPGMLHQVEVISGVLQEECLQILQQFFRERRQTGK